MDRTINPAKILRLHAIESAVGNSHHLLQTAADHLHTALSALQRNRTEVATERIEVTLDAIAHVQALLDNIRDAA